MRKQIKKTLESIRSNNTISDLTLRQANSLYVNGQCQMLTVANDRFDIAVDDEYNDFNVSIFFESGKIQTNCECKSSLDYCHHTISGLMELSDYLREEEGEKKQTGKTYTRAGMIKRVLNERRDKARKAEYVVEFSDNPFGEHELKNERGIIYKLTFRDFKNEHGYCSCPDYRTNKLGTCKHLIYAFDKYDRKFKRKLPDSVKYPFVEIFLDPLNDYKISWFYPHSLPMDIKPLIKKYFDDSKYLQSSDTGNFLGFLQEAESIKQIKIREEVRKLVEDYFDNKIIEQTGAHKSIDYSKVKANLFPYQKSGIEFGTFRKNAIIADDMGLGKTVQAIGIAIAKKELFGLRKTLVICPASIKDQWKREIERFSDESAVIVQGFPKEREQIYRESSAYFTIINYETVLRDLRSLQKFDPDFIILDEAQRIKNYETHTANSIKQLPKKHALVITGTPIENKLIDLFSVVGFLDPYMLTPLWEFSYQHCYFDHQHKNKITGYYNLQNLKKRMQPLLLRREKREVLDELPNISQMDVPIKLHPRQADFHSSYARGVAAILGKKFITPYDMQKLMLLLTKMRMVCDSTYLVDQETNISPKLDELKYILLEKIDIKHSGRKVVIFSEWVRMNNIIRQMLRENDVGFVELNGSVPVPKRAKLIREFEINPHCKVFLSSEAGGTGLNLQVADTVINFELPWNPAKKNQRIGRIDRLGQKNKKLTVINLITEGSIEMKILAGLELKQDLFDGVLNEKSKLDALDISQRGRSQFLEQLGSAIDELAEEEIEETAVKEEKSELREFAEELAEEDKLTELEEERTDEKEMPKTAATKEKADQEAEQIVQVMNKGMDFLSGLMKMATGNDLGVKSNSLEINKETGEVVMKFKLPGFGK